MNWSTPIVRDPSKFNRHGIAHVADFHQVDYLVSSKPPNDDIRAVLEENKVTLAVPES